MLYFRDFSIMSVLAHCVCSYFDDPNLLNPTHGGVESRSSQ